MISETLPAPADALLSSLDALAGGGGASLTAAQQAGLLSLLGRVEAKVGAIKLKVLAAAEDSGTSRACGAATTAQWAAKVTNSDQAVSHREAGLARGLRQRPKTAG